MQSTSTGDALLTLVYKPSVQKIQGVVHKVTNIEQQDLTGLAGTRTIQSITKLFIQLVHTAKSKRLL